MLKIRKANMDHDCLICSGKIKKKNYYIQISKENRDGTYQNGAICEKCTEELIISQIKES